MYLDKIKAYLKKEMKPQGPLKLLVFLAGFHIGVTIADITFDFDQQKRSYLREKMEDDFWKIHGTPEFLKPKEVISYKPGNEGKMRTSYIQAERFFEKMGSRHPKEYEFADKVKEIKEQNKK